jgi:hypothetical protein
MLTLFEACFYGEAYRHSRHDPISILTFLSPPVYSGNIHCTSFSLIHFTALVMLPKEHQMMCMLGKLSPTSLTKDPPLTEPIGGSIPITMTGIR